MKIVVRGMQCFSFKAHIEDRMKQVLFLPSHFPVSMPEWHSVLVLARIKWIFFLVDVIVPCFGLRMRIAQWCFSSCWAGLTMSQGVFNFSCCSASKEAEGAQGAEKEHSWESWPQLTKGIFHTIRHHAEQGMGQLVWEVATAAQGLEENWLAGGELLCASLVLYILLSLLLLSHPFL